MEVEQTSSSSDVASTIIFPISNDIRWRGQDDLILTPSQIPNDVAKGYLLTLREIYNTFLIVAHLDYAHALEPFAEKLFLEVLGLQD